MKRVIAALIGLAIVFTAVPADASIPAGLPGTPWERHVDNLVVKLLNQERAARHLAPLREDRRLLWSTWYHSVDMARYNTLSHQLPNEAFFSTRISRTGYHWCWAGENAAWTSGMGTSYVLDLERAMYNEKPPGEIGHRLNILNPHFQNVGAEIYVDYKHHKIWLTEDFGGCR